MSHACVSSRHVMSCHVTGIVIDRHVKEGKKERKEGRKKERKKGRKEEREEERKKGSS